MKYSKEDLQKIKLPLSRETYQELKENGVYLKMSDDFPKELKDEYFRVMEEIFDEKYPNEWND